MERGEITQRGTPEELRNAPRTPYVADLVGVNLFAGRLEPLDDGAGRVVTDDGDVVVPWPDDLPRDAVDGVLGVLRPSDVVLHTVEPEGSARNVLRGRIAEIAIEGERARVRLAGAPPVVAEITLGSVGRLGLREGERCGRRSRRSRSSSSCPEHTGTRTLAAAPDAPTTGTLDR